MSLDPNKVFDEEEELEKNRTTGADNKKCTNCSGPLRFNPSTQKMKCDYCESEFDIPRELDENEKKAQEQEKAARAKAKAGQAGAAASAGAAIGFGDDDESEEQLDQAYKARNRKGERPLSEADEKKNCDWGSKKKMVTCKTCGAQTIYDAVQTATACPYCDSNQIMEEDNKDDSMAPTGICVFKVEKDQARQKFHDWVGGLWFAPSSLKKMAQADSIDGVYLPHWTFDAKSRAKYTGEYGIDRKETDSEGKEKTRTDWYNTSGRIKHFFDDFLMPACRKENNNILENLAPFNTNDYEDYKPEYMAGYAAERYSVTVHEAWETAQKRMKNELENLAREDIKKRHSEADSARVNSLDAEFSEVAFKYLFLPIWISSYRFNGKVYQFMVNGQTGKISGARPYSGWKIFFAILIVLVILYWLLGN